MKKLLCLILSLVMLLLIAGCNTPAVDTPVLPATRVGNGELSASLPTKYTFKSAAEEADVVARIRIGDWLSEDTYCYQTFYEATVLECFKGKLPKSFVLAQLGCSTGTFRNYPLFTSGNEFLVFLKEAPEDLGDIKADYDSLYWIFGHYSTLLDVAYDESGNRYYTDWCGNLGESANTLTNYANNKELYKQIYANAIADDPIRSELNRTYPYIFAEEEVIALLNKK